MEILDIKSYFGKKKEVSLMDYVTVKTELDLYKCIV